MGLIIDATWRWWWWWKRRRIAMLLLFTPEVLTSLVSVLVSFPVPTATSLSVFLLLPLWDPWMMGTWWTRTGAVAVPCDERVR